MLGAVNRICEHEGRQYHVQAEDLGVPAAAFEVRVYDHGTVLFNKRVSYQDVLAKGLSRAEQDEEVLSLMRKTMTTVEAAIVKGKLA